MKSRIADLANCTAGPSHEGEVRLLKKDKLSS